LVHIFGELFTLHVLQPLTKNSLKTFIEMYQMVLPCFGCRLHFSMLLANNPMPEQNIFEWSVDIHNLVNERIGKPTVTYTDAYKHWMSGCDPEEPEPMFDTFTITLIILAILFMIAIMFKNYRR
jgi:hypothetical protein